MERNEFRFGDTVSSTFGLTCDRETHFLLPALQTFTKAIPGLDGVVDFGIGGYGVRALPADIYYDGDYATLRANREAIIAWLYSDHGAYKQLEFGDEPGKYYMAKITGELSFTNSDDRKIGTIQWMCNPPWQYRDGILLTPEEIAWNTADEVDGNQYIKSFSAPGSTRLTNTGTLPVKPVIKLLGNIPAGLLLTYGSAQWQYNEALPYDGIIIDCASETVTQASSGASVIGNVDSSKNAFLELASGHCEIGVSATGIGAWPLNLVMIIQFDSMNLG